MFNRPGVAEAVLQTPLSLINSLIILVTESSFVEISSEDWKEHFFQDFTEILGMMIFFSSKIFIFADVFLKESITLWQALFFN